MVLYSGWWKYLHKCRIGDNTCTKQKTGQPDREITYRSSLDCNRLGLAALITVATKFDFGEDDVVVMW